MQIAREIPIRSENYRVKSFDTDYRGEMFIHQICRLFQEAAHHHADHLGVGFRFLAEKSMTWALLSLRVSVDRYPRWGDHITVQTWPSNHDRLYYYRDFRILNDAAETVARAVSKWLVIDVTRRRPVKTENLSEFRFPFQATQFEGWIDKISPPALMETVGDFRVGYTDLDVNRHLNNTRFIERIIATYPLEFIERMMLREMEINFLAEAQYGDEAAIQSSQSPDGTHYVTMTRGADSKELSRMRLRWNKI